MALKNYVKMVVFILLVSIENAVDWINHNIIKRFLSPNNRIDKIYSVSIIVGSNKCNANCGHCGGRSLRRDALDEKSGTIRGMKSALALCHKYGGWTISLTGSGEPTLSPDAVTETLKEINKLEGKGIVFPFINLFTNGIELVNNPKMREHYLPLWRDLGLTTIVISIHDVDYKRNKEAYSVGDNIKFPRPEEMIQVVKDAGLVLRVNLLLHKGYCDNLEDYKRNLNALKEMGVSMVTCWSLCKPSGEKNEFTPDFWNLFKIRFFMWSNCNKIFNQVWNGGVYNYHGLSVRLTTYVSEHRPTNDFVRQLVLFQDGTIAYSWYQEGAICLK